MKWISLIAALSIASMSTAVLASSHGQGQGGGQGRGAEAAHFFEQWDMNEDGSVTVEDISARRADLFDMFDLNGDGSIDTDEQANMAQTITGQEENNREGHGRNGPGPRIHAAMAPGYNDADANGLVSASEFAAASALLFADLDRNADGQIDRHDFGRR